MLLLCDSFDTYSTAQILRKYTATAGTCAIGAANGRFGNGMQVTVNGSPHGATAVFAPTATVITGMAVKVSAVPPSQTPLFRLVEGAVSHITIGINAVGAILAIRGTNSGTLLGSSPAGAVPIGSFSYVEAKIVVHDTTGSVVIRINGIVVLTLTGIDTRNAGTTGLLDGIVLGGDASSSNGSITYDDFYLCNAAGAVNNDFLGDIRVQALLPDGTGNYAEWAPSAGANWQCVDENPTTDDTDFVSSSTPGQRDTYTMGALTPLTGTVFGVAVNAVARKDDAGARTIRTMVRSGGVDANGATVAETTSYVNYQQIYETDPVAVAWTVTTVNAMEAGTEEVT